MENNVMNELSKLISKAIKHDEVPVAAIIVKNNKIVSKAYNKKNKYKNPLMHAEVIAIKKAVKKIGDWRLNDCTMYVTLKPCHMCEAIIRESRISNVYYLLNNVKTVNHNTSFSQVNSKLTKDFETALKTFFERKR